MRHNENCPAMYKAAAECTCKPMHTKGKLETCESFGLAQINGKTAFVVMPVTCDTVEEITQKKDNIERLLNCWNNFDGLLEVCKMIKKRLLTHGEWDDNCFYYSGKSASELEEPLKLIDSALAAAEKGE